MGAAIVVVLIIAAIAGVAKVHLLYDGIGGTALWNPNEADFFIEVRHRGQVINSLRFPLFVIKNHLGGVEDLDAERGSLVFIRISATGVKRHVLPLDYTGMYTPLYGQIYANNPDLGGLCRWSGERFVPATPEEKRRLDGINRLTNQDIPESRNGWYKRSFQAAPGDDDNTFTIAEEPSFRISGTDMAAQNGDRLVSIILQRPGRPYEKIWDIRLVSGRVTSKQYQETFGKPR